MYCKFKLSNLLASFLCLSLSLSHSHFKICPAAEPERVTGVLCREGGFLLGCSTGSTQHQQIWLQGRGPLEFSHALHPAYFPVPYREEHQSRKYASLCSFSQLCVHFAKQPHCNIQALKCFYFKGDLPQLHKLSFTLLSLSKISYHISLCIISILRRLLLRARRYLTFPLSFYSCSQRISVTSI